MSDFSTRKLQLLSKQRLIRLLHKIAAKLSRDWHAGINNLGQLNQMKTLARTLKDYPDSTIQQLNRDVQSIKSGDKQGLDSLLVQMEKESGFFLTDVDLLADLPDGQRKTKLPMPVDIVLDNLRSGFNVGSIFRTAECMGVRKIYLFGYTPGPEQKKVAETAMGTASRVEWENVAETNTLFKKLTRPVVCLESAKNADPLHSFDFDFPCTMILGNEKYGIRKELLEQADNIVQIPVYGWKNSLNVGVAFGMAVSHVRWQWDSKT